MAKVKPRTLSATLAAVVRMAEPGTFSLQYLEFINGRSWVAMARPKNAWPRAFITAATHEAALRALLRELERAKKGAGR